MVEENSAFISKSTAPHTAEIPLPLPTTKTPTKEKTSSTTSTAPELQTGVSFCVM